MTAQEIYSRANSQSTKLTRINVTKHFKIKCFVSLELAWKLEFLYGCDMVNRPITFGLVKMGDKV